ncbi:MAG: hypothetical protein GX087_03145 [Desulfobulbaceae bacterium]|nr:hypothetical protein [Desulfobulbaceae bacterium]
MPPHDADIFKQFKVVKIAVEATDHSEQIIAELVALPGDLLYGRHFFARFFWRKF